MIGIVPIASVLIPFLIWGLIIYGVYTIVNSLGRIARSLERIEAKLGENTSPLDPLS